MRPALCLLLLVAACDQRKGPAADMKPAEDWSAPAEKAADPHAGMDMTGGGGDPHGAVDPHAGVDMTGPGGLPAPDPDRPIDPNKYLRGSIELGKGVKAPAGGVIFLSVRPAAGGPPLAVDLVKPGNFPIAFEMTEAQAMIGGTAFAGEVTIKAALDQDEDVDTKQPGDLVGTVKATIPAEGLKVILGSPP